MELGVWRGMQMQIKKRKWGFKWLPWCLVMWELTPTRNAILAKLFGLPLQFVLVATTSCITHS